MRNIRFERRAQQHMDFWEKAAPAKARKIARLVMAAAENPFSGIGKPEPLRHEYSGCWSRHITQEHRLVYKVTDEAIIVLSCRFHYE